MSFVKEDKLKCCADPSLPYTKQSLDNIKKHRRIIREDLVKNLGDLIPSSAFAQIPEKFFKKSIPESWIGAGGLIAGLVASYQIWSK